MKKLLVLAVIVATALGGYFLWGGISDSGSSTPPEQSLFAVKRGDLTIQVTENGYLKAKNSEKLSPEFRGEGLITWLVEEGAEVEEGDVLVEFEKKELQGQIDQLESEIVQSEVTLEGLRATNEIELRDSQAAIEKAELALAIAELELKKWVEGEDPNEMRRLELEEKRSLREWERAEENFKLIPELAKEGFFTQLEVEIEELAVEQLKITYENAQRAAKLYVEYSRETNRRQKESGLSDAQRGPAERQANLRDQQQGARGKHLASRGCLGCPAPAAREAKR